MSERKRTYRMREAWRARRVRRARARGARRAAGAGRRTAALKAVAWFAVFALLVALAFIVGDSSYHATVVGWMPPVAMLAATALAYGYLQLLRRRLRFQEDTFAASCQRGRDVRFSVRFSNPLPLFVFRLDARLVIADPHGNEANATTTSLTLAPFESQSFGFAMRFDHIGRYEAGLDRVVLSDFLGLFTTTIVNGRRAQVNVTPLLHPVGGLRFSNDALMEASRAAQAVLADSMDYAYSREYAPGDPLKTIHWKLSARSDHYMTRLYETYTNPGVCIVLDFYGPADDAEALLTMFDTVVEAGFAIADYARGCGYATEMRFAARDGSARTVRRFSVEEMPQVVADMPPMRRDEGLRADARDIVNAQLASRAGHNNLVVVTADLDADMVSLVLGARAHQRAPLLVAVVPAGLAGRARDAYCKPLARLDAANVPYVAVAHADELSEMGI